MNARVTVWDQPKDLPDPLSHLQPLPEPNAWRQICKGKVGIKQSFYPGYSSNLQWLTAEKFLEILPAGTQQHPQNSFCCAEPQRVQARWTQVRINIYSNPIPSTPQPSTLNHFGLPVCCSTSDQNTQLCLCERETNKWKITGGNWIC